MSGYKKGWCPSAARPMESGDGLLVRLHFNDRIFPTEQARAVAALAIRYGNGHLDLTSRGNLQIRGVTAGSYDSLFSELSALGLVDEQRPAKIESSGGMPVPGFCKSIPSLLGGGLGWGYEEHRRSRACPSPGLAPTGVGVITLGLPFGRLEAHGLEWLADIAQACGDGLIYLTPWRMVMLSGIEEKHADMLLREAATYGFIICDDDARRLIEACPGTPACSSAQGDTRALALAIADALPQLAQTVHVSGCAKGCACGRATDVVITARNGAYDMAFDAKADAVPAHAGLDQQAVIELLRHAKASA